MKMKTILIFIPRHFDKEKPGQMFGKIVNDEDSEVKKFYIIGMKSDSSNKYSDILGYFNGNEDENVVERKGNCDWIDLRLDKEDNSQRTNYNYYFKNITVNGKSISIESCDIISIIYDQISLLHSEIHPNSNSKDHFSELKRILAVKVIHNQIFQRNMFHSLKESIFVNIAQILLILINTLCKITEISFYILKYSTLGLNLNGWLNNMKWMLNSIIGERRITIKTGNHILITILDIFLGILSLEFLTIFTDGVAPSTILLDNAEIVVESLKGLVNWLMGSPAGLKLNHALSGTLGKFFLYHIHLWWNFLIALKPFLDFAFDFLLLIGRLGVTFQISIVADLLALVSFHAYCIYVYAARLFEIQVSGLIALFRLFLGKKKNPLRERIDSCEYQPDQLFVGTLLFTILLFLMPTTWVYYSVFTTLRLIMIGLSGTLTRLQFYLQIIPIYTFIHWLFQTKSLRSSINIRLHIKKGGPITLICNNVVPPWSEVWKKCTPDTIKFHPSIEWSTILGNIIWGRLLYPL